jgi:uncharacterized protein
MRTLLWATVIAMIVVILLYAALLTAIYYESDRLVFAGAGIAVQPAIPASTFPGAEDVTIPVGSATFAHGWWIPSARGAHQTLLYFHGNGYALEDELDSEAVTLYQTGANLLLVDYRGYGTSSKLSTSAASTASDARAAFRYLIDQRHIPPSNIWILGRSIGASVAVRLAVENPHAGGLILITPLTNTADVEPYRTLVKPLVWLGLTKDWDSLARMPRIHMPVAIIAGAQDTLAQPWMARALFSAANNPKSLKIIDGAGHNDILDVATYDVNAEIDRALGIAPPTAR